MMTKKSLLPWLMIFGAGLCLRTGIASVSPLLETIQHELGISGSALGLLTAIPVVCMGVLSPLGHAFDRRLGLKRSMIAALVILTAGLALRLETKTFGLLLVTAAMVGIGDAIIRPLLSGFIKETFHDRTHAAMGLYATAMGVGSAAAAYLTPYLSGGGERWQQGLAFWAMPALAAAALWMLWPYGGHENRRAETKPGSGLCRLEVAALTLFFGLQAGLNYTAVAWLLSLFQAAGYSQHASGGLIALFLILQTLTSLGFPLVMRVLRLGIVGAMILFSLMAVLGCLTLWWLPQAAWGTAVLLGVASGALFPIALLLPLEFSDSRSEATRLSGVTQSGGYLLGGVTPWLAGIAADDIGPAAGIAALSLIVAIALFVVVIQVGGSHSRRVKDKREKTA